MVPSALLVSSPSSRLSSLGQSGTSGLYPESGPLSIPVQFTGRESRPNARQVGPYSVWDGGSLKLFVYLVHPRTILRPRLSDSGPSPDVKIVRGSTTTRSLLSNSSAPDRVRTSREVWRSLRKENLCVCIGSVSFSVRAG